MATAYKLTLPQQFAILSVCKKRGFRAKHPSAEDREFMAELSAHFHVSMSTIIAIANAHPHNYKFAWRELEALGVEAMYEKYKELLP